MCKYVSVVATVEGDLEIFGAPNLDSHGDAREGWCIRGGAEVEWTSEGKDYLTVRYKDPAISKMVKCQILEKYKTRQGLIDSIVIAKDRYKTVYLKHGKRHNSKGPAVVCADGAKFWYRNGKLHNSKGPAVVRASGSKSWYRNGKLHNSKGPAVVYAYGAKFWYRNGKLHNLKGPAIVCADGTKEFWINDERQPST